MNKYKIAGKKMVGMALEQELWGSPFVRLFWGASIFFLVTSLMNIKRNTDSIYVAIAIFVLIIVRVVRIVNICKKAGELCKDKAYEFTITISDDKFTKETRMNGEITQKEEFSVSDMRYLCSVKNYSFLYFNDRKFLVFENDSFENGSIADVKELMPKGKR